MHDSTSSVTSVLPPSAKAVGKRPAIPDMPTSDTNALAPVSSASTPSASTVNANAQTRPKRILPSRSRRGGSGVGVGNCDVDIMILETRRRRLENEPLIPAHTQFLLTTNSALVPPAEDNTSFEFELNQHAYGRYFDRPEVQKAYREQQTIQTPEYTQLPEDASVGGRFRPRGGEEESVDTSDAAYEKRHRKYETFEKRQRLREKEKLKHEQYKLKERIEQLRAMDTSAFLALPASAFSDTTGPVDLDVHDTDPGLSDLPGAHINGAAAYNEGERRRKEMLDVAMTLEDRYRVLLPPDRKWIDRKERLAKRESTAPTISLEPETVPEPSPPASEEEEESEEEPEPPKPPSPIVYTRQDSEGESEVDFEERERQRSKQLKLRIKFPPRKPEVLAPPLGKLAKPLLPFQGPPHRGGGKVFPHPLTVPPPFSPVSAVKSRTVFRSKDGKFLSKKKRHLQDSGQIVSAPAPSRKRPRAGSSASQRAVSPTTSAPKQHVSYAGAAGRTERTTCALLVSALRNATAPSARKTQRHVTAFGIRVPPEIEEVRDYQMPEWISSSMESRHSESVDDRSSVGLNGYGPPSIFEEQDAMEFKEEELVPSIATLE